MKRPIGSERPAIHIATPHILDSTAIEVCRCIALLRWPLGFFARSPDLALALQDASLVWRFCHPCIPLPPIHCISMCRKDPASQARCTSQAAPRGGSPVSWRPRPNGQLLDSNQLNCVLGGVLRRFFVRARGHQFTNEMLLACCCPVRHFLLRASAGQARWTSQTGANPRLHC